MNRRTTLLLALACLGVPPAYSAKPEALVVNTVAVLPEPVPFVAEPAGNKAEPETTKQQPGQADQSDEVDAKPADQAASEKDLLQKMLVLEQQLQEARQKIQQKAIEQRQKVQKEAIKKLDEIKLPKNPTRKQCEDFIADLRQACEGRRSLTHNDPVTQKLKEVPVEHLDLLLTEMANRTSLRYYTNYVIRDIDPDKLRKRFVESINEKPDNIGVIVMHGWSQDVRPAIIDHLNSADGSINAAWFQAAVEIDEPSLYPKLHELTIQSRQASQFITMLEMLPDYDLSHTIDVCWDRARQGKLSVNYSTFAAKAAAHGNVDALGVLVDQLRSSSSYTSSSSFFNTRRTNVLRFIDYRGSNQEIRAWFKTNKDKLVFDHLTKRFVLPEDF